MSTSATSTSPANLFLEQRAADDGDAARPDAGHLARVAPDEGGIATDTSRSPGRARTAFSTSCPIAPSPTIRDARRPRRPSPGGAADGVRFAELGQILAELFEEAGDVGRDSTSKRRRTPSSSSRRRLSRAGDSCPACSRAGSRQRIVRQRRVSRCRPPSRSAFARLRRLPFRPRAVCASFSISARSSSRSRAHGRARRRATGRDGADLALVFEALAGLSLQLGQPRIGWLRSASADILAGLARSSRVGVARRRARLRRVHRLAIRTRKVERQRASLGLTATRARDCVETAQSPSSSLRWNSTTMS